MTTAVRRLRAWLILGCILGGFPGGRVLGQDWDKPIPQNPKKQEQRYTDRLDWFRKTLLEAYEKVGKKDPRWDEDARAGLEAAVRYYSRDNVPRSVLREARDGFRRAMDVGCDDPMVLQLEAFASNGVNDPSTDQVIHRFLKATDALEQSPYPAIRKVWALTTAVKDAAKLSSATDEEKQGIPRHLDLILKWLPVSASEESSNPWIEDYRLNAFRAVLDRRRALTLDVEGTLTWIDEQVQRMPKDLQISWLQTQADFFQAYAWEARGTGTADTVTEDGLQKMNARIARAKTLIDQAWTLKPGNFLTAHIQLNLTIASDGDRAEMERWFQRAIEANGNSIKSCRTKIQWLEPKWFGSAEDLIAFGRRCGDTKNWQSQISLLEAECYLIATSARNEPPGGDFWRSPEVWERCRASFDEYLSHFPEDNSQRSKYAIIASLTGHHTEATEQYQKLGENFFYFKNWGMTEQWFRDLREESAKQPKGVKPSPSSRPSSR